MLAAEVISPANRKTRVAQKVDMYLANGVSAVWVAYPKKWLLRMYQIDEIAEFSEAHRVTLPQPLQGQINIRDMFLIG